ncbi:MAG: molecular chaperone [Bacteroidota bacterium]
MIKKVLIKKVKGSPGFTCMNLFLLGMFFISTIYSPTLVAQGNFYLTVKRLVFENSRKPKDFDIVNSGSDSAKFEITVINNRMNKDGSFELISKPDSGQNFAEKYLRIYPRTIKIGPKGAQKIKVQLIKADNLPPGEYRSHIQVKAAQKVTLLGEKDLAKKDSTKVSVKLTPEFSITVPVVLWSGQSDAKVKLSNLSLEKMNDSVSKLNLTFDRSGNFSVYGDLNVNYISAQGKVIPVGMAKGIAVYTPNKSRYFQLQLKKIAGVDFHSGKLMVSYVAASDTKGAKLAEADLPLK